MDRDTLVRVGRELAAQLCDVDSMTAADCTTVLEDVLFERLRTIRSKLEALGLEFDSRVGCVLSAG